MKTVRLIIISLSLLLFLQIPVFAEIESSVESFSSIKMIFKLIFYLVIFILILIFTLYGTKFIAQNFNGMSKSKYIDFIDNVNISTSMKIMIIEINSIVYILASNNENIELIDKYNSEDFQIIDKDIDNYNTIIKGNDLMNKIKSFIDKEDKNEKKY